MNNNTTGHGCFITSFLGAFTAIEQYMNLLDNLWDSILDSGLVTAAELESFTTMDGVKMPEEIISDLQSNFPPAEYKSRNSLKELAQNLNVEYTADDETNAFAYYAIIQRYADRTHLEIRHRFTDKVLDFVSDTTKIEERTKAAVNLWQNNNKILYAQIKDCLTPARMRDLKALMLALTVMRTFRLLDDPILKCLERGWTTETQMDLMGYLMASAVFLGSDNIPKYLIKNFPETNRAAYSGASSSEDKYGKPEHGCAEDYKKCFIRTLEEAVLFYRIFHALQQDNSNHGEMIKESSINLTGTLLQLLLSLAHEEAGNRLPKPGEFMNVDFPSPERHVLERLPILESASRKIPVSQTTSMAELRALFEFYGALNKRSRGVTDELTSMQTTIYSAKYVCAPKAVRMCSANTGLILQAEVGPSQNGGIITNESFIMATFGLKNSYKTALRLDKNGERDYGKCEQLRLSEGLEDRIRNGLPNYYYSNLPNLANINKLGTAQTKGRFMSTMDLESLDYNAWLIMPCYKQRLENSILLTIQTTHIAFDAQIGKKVVAIGAPYKLLDISNICASGVHQLPTQQELLLMSKSKDCAPTQIAAGCLAMANGDSKEPKLYKLRSVILFDSPGGHYTVFIKGINVNEWIYLDGARALQLSQHEGPVTPISDRLATYTITNAYYLKTA
jgi:hypothetical protein